MNKTIPLIDRCLRALALEFPDGDYSRAIAIITTELSIKDALIKELAEALEKAYELYCSYDVMQEFGDDEIADCRVIDKARKHAKEWKNENRN